MICEKILLDHLRVIQLGLVRDEPEPMIPPQRIYCITSQDQAPGIRKALPQCDVTAP